MSKKRLSHLLLVLCLNGFLAYSQQITPVGPTVVTPGQAFSVNIVVSNVTDLFAYQFDLSFTPTTLAATSTAQGPFLAIGGPTFFVPGTIDNVIGTIGGTTNTLLGPVPGVSGSGSLATVDFTVLAIGIAPITLSNVIFLDSTLSPIPVTIGAFSVTVVPEPGSLTLFGSIALALLAYGLRRRGRAMPLRARPCLPIT